MALEDVWNQGKKTLILFERGNFGATKDVRWTLAPFNLVAIAGTQYLVPRDTHRAAQASSNGDYATATSTVAYAPFNLSQGEFFISDILRMGEHEMGDWQGNAGLIWKGVHQFGQL